MLRHLIVQLPGVGGSVLSEPNSRTAWNTSLTGLAGAATHISALDLSVDLVPTRLTSTTSLVPGLTLIAGYDIMIKNLRDWFGGGIKVVDYIAGTPVPDDTDVLRVPYDFRQSITDSAETVARAVAEARGAERGVIVLAHSMGGLVARYWIGALGGSRVCQALISLGTPYRGAPKALDLLFNGVGFLRWRHRGLTRVLRSWPSVYELLPQYPAIATTNDSDRPKAIEPTDLAESTVAMFERGSAGGPVDVLRMARAAAATHQDLADSWAAVTDDVQLAPFFGRGHKTLNWAGLIGGRVSVTKADPAWRSNVGWRGDGTVPTISAIPAELSERQTRWRGVADKHGPMGGTAEVRDVLTSLLGEKIPKRGALEPSRPWLGFDLDDTIIAGRGSVLEVEVIGSASDPGSKATARLSSIAGDPMPAEVPLTFASGRWTTKLPELPPGSYTADVTVAEAWHGTAVYGAAPFVVLRDDGDWVETNEAGATAE